VEGEWLLSVEGRVRLTVRVAKERVPWSEKAKIATRMRVRLGVRMRRRGAMRDNRDNRRSAPSCERVALSN